MLRTFCLAVALSAFAAASAEAQAPRPAPPNVRAVLQAADAAIGASKLNSVQYSGTGYVTSVGQNYSSALDDTWPRFDLKSYVRTIDYPSMSMKDEQVRVQGAWPANRGGGVRPIVGERRQTQFVTGNFAWNLNGETLQPQPTQAELRQVDIMMTPHGFIRAALAAKDATLSQQSQGTGKANIVTFKAFGKFTINGWINSDNLVTKTQTWLPHPILGDMFVELRTQGGYKDYGGIKFPNGFHQSVGNPPHPGLEVDITDVKPNVAAPALVVPEAVRQAREATPAAVASRQLAPGIWLLPGPYNSLAVEFRNYSVVLEAPNTEERGFALIDETKRLIPNKPIRYVLNTHHHFDHSGGLRAFGAENAIVITHESNFGFYEGVVFDLRPRLVQPDPLSLAPRQVHYVLVKESYTLTDGDQTMNVYHMDALEHAADMLVAWFPKAKILFQADMFDPPRGGAPAPATPSANAMNLLYNLQRVGIQPETIVSVHGGVYPAAEFAKGVGVEKILARGGGGGLNAALNP